MLDLPSIVEDSPRKTKPKAKHATDAPVLTPETPEVELEYRVVEQPDWLTPRRPYEPEPRPAPAPTRSSPWPDGEAALAKLEEACQAGGWFWKAIDTLVLQRDRKVPFTPAQQFFIDHMLGPDTRVKNNQRDWSVRQASRLATVLAWQDAWHAAVEAGDRQAQERAEAMLRRSAPAWTQPRAGEPLAMAAIAMERVLGEKRTRRQQLQVLADLRTETPRIVDGEVRYMFGPPSMNNSAILEYCRSHFPADHPAYPGRFTFPDGREVEQVEAASWPTVRAEMRREIAVLDSEIAKLEPEAVAARDKADAAVRARQSCYIPAAKE